MTIPTWPTSSPPARTLKVLLWILIACMIADPVLEQFGIPVPYYLALSPVSMARGFVWTLMTYPFTYGSTSLLDLLFRMAIDLLLLWIFGSALLERLNSKRFILLFLGATLCGGLAALGALYAFHRLFFSGLSPVLLALYTAWAILHGSTRSQSAILKFPWIVAILIGGTLLFDLWAAIWPAFFANLTGVLFAYFFCITLERAESGVRFLRPFELAVHRAIERWHAAKPFKTGSKVVDFKTGEPILDDDQFMDAMLARISLYGEQNLTPAEKQRMKKISQNKSNK